MEVARPKSATTATRRLQPSLRISIFWGRNAELGLVLDAYWSTGVLAFEVRSLWKKPREWR
jgi:hypothetical protein